MAAEGAEPGRDVRAEAPESARRTSEGTPSSPIESRIEHARRRVVDFEEYIDDIVRMLEYCRDYGIQIPAGLNASVAALAEPATMVTIPSSARRVLFRSHDEP